MGSSLNKYSLLDILYPPLCLHCDAYLEKGKKLFCSFCLEQLTLIDPQERCPTCFAEKAPLKKCARCCSRHRVIKHQAASLPFFGPASTLSACLKKGHEEKISAAASLLMLQWSELRWPLHDAVTSLPFSNFARFKRGYDVDVLLAKEIARFTMRPYIPYFKVQFDFATFLSKASFTTRYVLKEKEKRCAFDQRILIIALELDDLCFRAAGSLLQSAYAKEIYSLAFIDTRQEIHSHTQ